MSNANLIASEVQKLEIDSGVVSVYELEWSTGSTLYFHPGLSTDTRITGICGTSV